LACAIWKAGRFYEAVLAPLGYKRLYDSAEALGYGADSPKLFVMRVKRPVAADEASGLHLCLDAAGRAGVDCFHAAAVESGGRDNGKPGVRQSGRRAAVPVFEIQPYANSGRSYRPSSILGAPSSSYRTD
jgi:hypothetical protein